MSLNKENAMDNPTSVNKEKNTDNPLSVNKENALDKPISSNKEKGIDKSISMKENETYELENRIRNLIWTVSGDYTLDPHPDVRMFAKTPALVIYDAVKQGGLAKFFHAEDVSSYILKKLYLHAEKGPLMEAAQLCIEGAVGPRLDQERAGVRQIRQKAAEETLDLDFDKLAGYPLGRIKVDYLRNILDPANRPPRIRAKWFTRIQNLAASDSTDDIIHTIDALYNETVDPAFEKKYGSLDDVLGVTMEDLSEFDWKDFLDEEAGESSMQILLDEISESMVDMSMTASENAHDTSEEAEDNEPREEVSQTVVVSEEALARMYLYVRKNFGRTYLTPMEEKKRNLRFCQGIHENCRLYYTEGILAAPEIRNSQYVLAEKQYKNNLERLASNYRTVRRHIQILSDMIQKALTLRDESDSIRSDCGQIIPAEMWKVKRSKDRNLFIRTRQNDAADLVVDLLLDASGSQREREDSVAMQAYIVSEALSHLRIPCRVSSFCTFWNYTILRRFRDYDDDEEKNKSVLEFTTGSSNRDGLAIRAIGEELLEREETGKVLIVLSDGKPNDVLVQRSGIRMPEPYKGKNAVRNTGTEVRRLRQYGVSVLGIFVGKETELYSERKIFGKDFAYIRNMESFSHTVGQYLMRIIEQ